MNNIAEILPYVWGTVYFVLFIITGFTYVRQRNTTTRPNEYLSDRLVFYSCGYTKKLKILAMVTLSGFLVLLPCTITYYFGNQNLISALIAFVIGIIIMILIGRLPFRFREYCLVVDDQRVIVKYSDGRKEEKAFFVSNYEYFCRETKHMPPRLVFKGDEGKELLSLHFLRSNDAVTAGKMVEFIKKNGRMPLVQQVDSKKEALQQNGKQNKADQTVSDISKTEENRAPILTQDKFFELIMNVCDWDKSGNDDEVLAPLVDHLSKQSDDYIFAFEDIMSELLYDIDTRRNYEMASKCYSHNDDTFLYARCVAIINGKDYYGKVKSGKIKDLWKNEFEAILYVTRDAWAKKHGKPASEFPHVSPVSYETGSNKDGWIDSL